MATESHAGDGDELTEETDRLLHDEDRDRYELLRGEEVLAVLYYDDVTVHGSEEGAAVSVRDMRSTVVSPDHQGAGLGSQLVRFALDHVRGEGKQVVATCWFVAGWIGRHEEYASLLHDRGSSR